MTAQCLSLCENMTRPLTSDMVRLSQVNVAGGGQPTLITRYLSEQAAAGIILVGLCELNGWNKFKNDYIPVDNHPNAAYLAANGGFAHSHLMVHADQPYHIGIFAALPFQVVAEYGPSQGFQRGVLHVFVPKLRLHVVVAHLHAHDSVSRQHEAVYIADIVRQIMDKEGGLFEARVAVMGDLNTLSRWDAREHERMGLLQTLHRKDNPVWERLSRKFLAPNLSAVNYAPMDALLSTGLIDACVAACGGENSKGWCYDDSDSFSTCMKLHCGSSEPTEYPQPAWEWPVLNDGAKHPRVRLDYVLLSPVLASSRVRAGFDVNNISSHMSDHYPMSVSWRSETFTLY